MGPDEPPLARAGTEGLLRPLRPDGDAGETDGILGESAGRCQGWYFPLRVAGANPRTLQQGPADHTNPEVLSLPAPSLLCIALTCSPRSTPSCRSTVAAGCWTPTSMGTGYGWRATGASIAHPFKPPLDRPGPSDHVAGSYHGAQVPRLPPVVLQELKRHDDHGNVAPADTDASVEVGRAHRAGWFEFILRSSPLALLAREVEVFSNTVQELQLLLIQRC